MSEFFRFKDEYPSFKALARDVRYCDVMSLRMIADKIENLDEKQHNYSYLILEQHKNENGSVSYKFKRVKVGNV